jgi:hypothetical protein
MANVAWSLAGLLCKNMRPEMVFQMLQQSTVKSGF